MAGLEFPLRYNQGQKDPLSICYLDMPTEKEALQRTLLKEYLRSWSDLWELVQQSTWSAIHNCLSGRWTCMPGSTALCKGPLLSLHMPFPDLSWKMVCRDCISKKKSPWPGIKSRTCHLIFSWVHCLLDSLNLTHSFLFHLYRIPDLTYFSILLCPQDYRTFFFFLPRFTTLFPSHVPPPPTHTHIRTQTHSLTL